MPSPAFRINAGAAGADVAVGSGAAVVAIVDNLTGVRSVQWSLVSTDETTVPASYTLIISGALGSQCSTTALANGTAAVLQCRINGGIDPATEAPSALMTTTQVFYVLGSNGLRVKASGEDPYATVRDVAIVNGAARAAGAGGFGTEEAQDAVGTILGATATITHTYNDATPSILSSVNDDSITNAKLANVATATFKGRTTAGTGDPEDLTATQATALLNEATAALKGLEPASHWALLNGATALATGSTLWLRDPNGDGAGRYITGTEFRGPAAVNAIIRANALTDRVRFAAGATTLLDVFDSAGSTILDAGARPAFLRTSSSCFVESTAGYVSIVAATDLYLTPATGIYHFRGVGGSNARTDTLDYTSSNSQVWAATVTRAIESFAVRASDSACASREWEGQAPFATATGTNRNSGLLKRTVAAPISGGRYGQLQDQFGTGTSQRLTSFGTVVTTDTTPTAVTAGSVDIADGTICHVLMRVTAQRTDVATDTASFSSEFKVERNGGGGASASSALGALSSIDAGIGAALATVTTDGAGTFYVEVRGVAATTIRWKCWMEVFRDSGA